VAHAARLLFRVGTIPLAPFPLSALSLPPLSFPFFPIFPFTLLFRGRLGPYTL